MYGPFLISEKKLQKHKKTIENYLQIWYNIIVNNFQKKYVKEWYC